MSAILPTNTCFDDVLDHQSAVHRLIPLIVERQFIVHGILLAPEGPHQDEPFAHAWVEDDVESRVYQSGIIDGQKIWWSADRTEWESKMRVQQRTRYTFEQALLLNYVSNHFGPWEPAYRHLCGRGQRIYA